MIPQRISKLLQKVYYDPAHPGGYGGVRRLYRQAKRLAPASLKFKKEDVK